MTEGVAFSFATWIALLVGIWFLFDKSESVASPDTKLRITRWLRRVEPRRPTGWPSTFALMFDHVFGARHLTWRCFWKSCLASLAAVALLLLLWATIYPKDFYALLSGRADIFISRRIPVILFGIMVLVGNFLPDYLSLLETRVVLRWMSGQSSVFTVLALGVVDLVASVTIVVVLAPLAWQLTVALYFGPILGELTNPPTSYAANLFRSLQRSVVELPNNLFGKGLIYELFSLRVGRCLALCVPWGVWTYASLFTSVWIWLYGAAGIAARMLLYVGWTVTWLRGSLDIETKPITSLGWVAMVLASIVYWGVALVMALR